MKKCDGVYCARRTPEKITYCCAECENANAGATPDRPLQYEHSTICNAREDAARSGMVVSSRPIVEGGEFPPIDRSQ